MRLLGGIKPASKTCHRPTVRFRPIDPKGGEWNQPTMGLYVLHELSLSGRVWVKAQAQDSVKPGSHGRGYVHVLGKEPLIRHKCGNRGRWTIFRSAET